jgi:hypothetical protein
LAREAPPAQTCTSSNIACVVELLPVVRFDPFIQYQISHNNELLSIQPMKTVRYDKKVSAGIKNGSYTCDISLSSKQPNLSNFTCRVSRYHSTSSDDR